MTAVVDSLGARDASLTLEYVILGHERDDHGEEKRSLLLFNGALPSHDPDFYTRIIDILPAHGARESCPIGMALVAYDAARMLLLINQPAKEAPEDFIDHYILMPQEALTEAANNYQRWLGSLPAATRDMNLTLPIFQPPAGAEVDIAARAANLGRLFDEGLGADFELLLRLLRALIHPQPLAIAGAPRELGQRLDFIAGLQALLPGGLAARVSFASNPPVHSQHTPQIAFVDDEIGEGYWRFDWRKRQVIGEAAEHPYAAVLRKLWSGDCAELAAAIQNMAVPRQLAVQASDLERDLREIARRYWVDHHVRAGDAVETDVMIGILDGPDAPKTKLRRLYVERLLENALNNRDSAAGRWMAEELERDKALDPALIGRFEAMLDDQPDAVYVFIRNRLINLGVDDRWIPRLHVAARKSLEVAIQDGDVGTLAGWLELIAHEPGAYQLHDILKGGILAASERAYADGELGIQLILIAARRVPEIVDDLYADEALINALETRVRVALQSPSAANLDALIDGKAEYFLLALYHGLSASDSKLVSGAAASRLIDLAESERRANLPALYRAPSLIRLLATQGGQQMSGDALDRLLRYILLIDDRAFISQAMDHLAGHDRLFPRLGKALRDDRLSPERAQSVLHAASASQSAAPQDLIACYYELLEHFDWSPETQRLAEALARLLAKHHDLSISYQHLWRLLEACQEFHAEAATRIVMTQLMIQFDSEADLSEVVDGLARICRQIAFSKSLQDHLNSWWRDYTHNRSLPQLHALQRELDKQRQLEDQKHIIWTVLAMRRWLHARKPTQLADAINTAYIMLDNITEAFDSASISETDPQTIRREVDRMSGELSSEQRHILANNMRNLARRISQMAEKRSKPSLMRSDDSIDRQLMHGEANPQGSIDMLKWIAGYLDGAHTGRDE